MASLKGSLFPRAWQRKEMTRVGGKTYLVSVGPERDSERPSETEIGELEVSVLVDEQVLRLEISMQDSVSVAIVEAFDQLKGESLLGDKD
jgi:hypothetical protein